MHPKTIATLACVEGEPFEADAALRSELTITFTKLQKTLRFRSWPLSDKAGGKFTIRGIVGVVSLPSGRTLEIVPKTTPSDDWIVSILSLLLGPDRIDAAAGRTGGLSAERRSLLPVIAAIYARRLASTIRRDGPLLLLNRQRRTLTSLRGKLDAGAWLRHALREPHIFPAETNNLTPDNDFAGAMAIVAGQLANYAGSPKVRATLLSAQRDLMPGLPLRRSVTPGTELRRLPSQWAAYEPAWKVACAILSQRSPLAPLGKREALSVAIEAWPLLERLLTRTLLAVARNYRCASDPVVTVRGGSGTRTLLSATPGSKQISRSVEPDGWLEVDGKTRVIFDAKYKKTSSTDWPGREDIYQVLCTASAFDAELAILVYPEQFDAICWDVSGMGGVPKRMAAIGLGLYSYRAGDGDATRGRALLTLLTSVGAVPPPTLPEA